MEIKKENANDEKTKKLISILEEKELIDLYNEVSKDLQRDICEFLDMIGYEELKKRSREEIIEGTIIREILKVKNNLLKDVDLKNIKQVEGIRRNTIYTLLENGSLYENDKLLDTDINMLHFIDGHIYKIKSNNVILPINNILKDELDYYLNNNNCKYKKVISNKIELVALTQEGDLRAFIVDYGFCILPENYKNVDDIIFVNKEYNSIPYIIKNGKQIPLNIKIIK